MSRLGKLPINLPAGVTAVMKNDCLVVKGPLGELSLVIVEPVKLEIVDQQIKVSVDNNHKQAKAFWGLFKSLINNMVEGVHAGFNKKLEINGVGYRAALSGETLKLNLGYSHPIDFVLPSGVKAVVEGNTITLSSIDKKLLGDTAFKIRNFRPPEPYKGKGIKYAEEVIRRKAGKTAAKGAK